MVFAVLSALLLALGAAGLWTGIRRLARGRLLGAAARGASGVLALVLGVAALGASVNLWTYHSLTWEQPVAKVSVTREGPQDYTLRLEEPRGETRELRVLGDEWQLDARVIKWKPVLALMGQGPRYRLERLSGRYRDIDEERTRVRTVHALAPERGLDLWSLARAERLPWVDAHYGSAVYVPLADGADYRVSLSASGLMVRPANEPATAVVASWN